jgi:hygromycin-B 7''-O-kinase
MHRAIGVPQRAVEIGDDERDVAGGDGFGERRYHESILTGAAARRVISPTLDNGEVVLTARASRYRGEAFLTRPPEVPLDAGQLLAAARGFGLPGKSFSKIPSRGIINSIYLVDDHYVVRVPRDHQGHFEQTRREASVLPAVVASGVTTAHLIAFDDSCSRLPVPYTIVEHAPGVDAESAGLEPPDPITTWRQFGRELALAHGAVSPVHVVGDTNASETTDLHDLLERRASEGWISNLESRRLHEWTRALTDHVNEPASPVLLHGDAQMSNVLVDPSSGAFNSLIDWGCAHMGNPAVDFRVVPLAAVAPMLDGYRDITGPTRPSLETEILLARLRLLTDVLPLGAAAGTTWGERPTAWLFDLFLTLATTADPRWTTLLERCPAK